MGNDFGEAIAAFVTMPETRQIAQPKKLNTKNINRKGEATHRTIGLLLVYFYNYESNHRFAATISFDFVSIPFLLQVLKIIRGKILCKHYQSCLREYDDHDFVCKNCESA